MAAPALATPANTRFAITFGAVLKETEDRQVYEKLVREQYRQYKPLAEHEIFLTQELADALWRLNRARKMEAEATTIDEIQKIARYIAHIERTYHRAYNELKKINAERNKATGMPYNLHSSYHHEPDWTYTAPAKTKLQNEPTPRQMEDLTFLMNEFRKSKRL